MKKNIKPRTDFEIKTRASFLLDNYKSLINYPNHRRATADQRFIYLYRNPLSELCKIGIASNARLRLAQLQNSCGLELQSLIVLELEEDYDEAADYIEKFLHHYFNDSRKFGEWFQLTIKDIIAVRNLFWTIEGINIWDNISFYLCKCSKYRFHDTPSLP